jgi:starch-binding outer membrane protein, SusD/RagB family
MKKRYIAGLACMALFSCKKEFLDLSPVSNANVQAFYRNANDMQVALNAAYASLITGGEYTNANWQVGEVRSDNTLNWEGGGNLPDAEVDLFKESSANSIINSMWLDTYHGILLSNIVIGRIENVEMSAELKKQFVAESKFLRALQYFNLVRTFGDVPLVLQETDNVQEGYQQGRVPVAKVYDQIVTDLTQAAAELPVSFSGANIGRATSGAAKSLLGKVLLTKGDYAGAAAILKEVIDAGNYHLLSNYADLYKPQNANNTESIFEVQYKKGGTGTGSSFHNQFAPRNSDLAVTIVGFAGGKNLPTADLVAAYEAGDLRKDLSLKETYKLNGQTIRDPYTIKYSDLPFLDGDADDNWIVLRYADVMLMYAEALNEVKNGPTTEAYDMVNAIRQRASLSPLPGGLSKNQFANAVAHERQVELAFEGHRWFDLLRTGKALEVMNAHFHGTITVKPYQLLFPVPQSQININPTVILQNPGYN